MSVKELPGAALIGKEIDVNCMKWTPKPSVGVKPVFIYAIREGEAIIAQSIPEANRSSITEIPNIGLDKGDSISGKALWICSDKSPKKQAVGNKQIRSARHSRQGLRFIAEKHCCGFIISTWKAENIVPPDPAAHLDKLLSLI